MNWLIVLHSFIIFPRPLSLNIVTFISISSSINICYQQVGLYYIIQFYFTPTIRFCLTTDNVWQFSHNLCSSFRYFSRCLSCVIHNFESFSFPKYFLITTKTKRVISSSVRFTKIKPSLYFYG